MTTGADLPVAAALRQGLQLRARCANPRCRSTSTLDASWWAAGHAADDRLSMVARRLRCAACGAREAEVELWNGAPPCDSGPGPYLFR